MRPRVPQGQPRELAQEMELVGVAQYASAQAQERVQMPVVLLMLVLWQQCAVQELKQQGNAAAATQKCAAALGFRHSWPARVQELATKAAASSKSLQQALMHLELWAVRQAQLVLVEKQGQEVAQVWIGLGQCYVHVRLRGGAFPTTRFQTMVSWQT